MKLTRASSYALAALAHLAREKPTAPVASHDMAAADGTPERFLLKVLKPLVDARVLRSQKGPSGGYVLARAPRDISVLEVVEAVDGPIRGDAPAVGSGAAATLDKRLQAVLDEAAGLARERLARVTLADLTKGK
jgi:Rrf2 family protein